MLLVQALVQACVTDGHLPLVCQTSHAQPCTMPNLRTKGHVRPDATARMSMLLSQLLCNASNMSVRKCVPFYLCRAFRLVQASHCTLQCMITSG